MSAPDPAATTDTPAAPASTFYATRSTLDRYRGIWLGVVLTFIVVICQISAQVVDFEFFHLRIRLLDSNSHASVFGVASLAAQALSALAAARRSRNSRRSTGWLVLALLTALLLVVRIGVSFRAAVLLGPVAALFVLVWYLTSDDPKPARTLVRAGLAALVFSYAVHVFGPHILADLDYAGNTWPYQIKGILKHSSELAGWMLMAVGISQGRSRPAVRHRWAADFHLPSEL
jgi:hypothetical protein